MRRLLLLVALSTAVALAGCDAGPDNGPDKGPGKGPTPTGGGRGGAQERGPDSAPDSVAGVPMRAGTHKMRIDVGTPGHREYLLRVPPKVANGRFAGGRPAEPPPLVLALHGGAANMSQMERLTGFDRIADEKGFLVAYPDGFMLSWNAGDCCGPAKIGKVDDVGFLTKLIDRLTGAGLADPRRVYVTGFSNGGGLAYKMACEGPGKVAGIGVVSAALAMGCGPERPVSVMVFHGTADRTVPYEGGGRRDFNDPRPYPPVSFAVEYWRAYDDVPQVRKKIQSAGPAACRSSGKGGNDAEVVLCTVKGGGHRWPAGASETLWAFFAAHPRPPG